MSRSGYSDDCDGAELNLWRGAVERAIRGKRGQAFLREMLAALDALPEQKLISDELQVGGEVCAIGSVGVRRRIDMSGLDPDDFEGLSDTFGIARALVQEIEYINDGEWPPEPPEARFKRVRAWVVSQIIDARA